MNGAGVRGRVAGWLPAVVVFVVVLVLWETTLSPKTRRLLKIDIADALRTDRVINELMGKDASARFRFIMDRADEAEELDV